MCVLCQSATGRQLHVWVDACSNDNAACREALAQLAVTHPGEGWMAIRVMP